MRIQHAFVAGAGLMGHGIAQVLASAGRSVDLYEPELARADAGRGRILGNLERVAAPLVRLHSSCFTGDLLASLRCDCGAQLRYLRPAQETLEDVFLRALDQPRA